MTKTNTVLARIDAGALFEGFPAPGAAAVTFLDPQAPNVSVFDLGVIRGDGIFEATTVWRGTPLALKLHLLRLSHSAQLADYPALKLDGWEQTIGEVLARFAAEFDSDKDALLKILVTRGADGSTMPGRLQNPGTPHVFVFVDEYDSDPNGTDSVRLVTLPKEVSTTAKTVAPWMLYGVKTLSYAMNMATYREVARRNADNAVFFSTDGYVLEGPTSSVVFRIGDAFYTPSPSLGILHGTTQQEFFAYLHHEGLTAEYGVYTRMQLQLADQVWVMGGSTIHPAKVIDGRELDIDQPFTDAANLFMRTQRSYVEEYALAEHARLAARFGD